MSPDELKPSWVKLKDMQEHIKELEQLIRDWQDWMQTRYPHSWNTEKDGILLQVRIRELVRRKDTVQHE